MVPGIFEFEQPGGKEAHAGGLGVVPVGGLGCARKSGATALIRTNMLWHSVHRCDEPMRVRDDKWRKCNRKMHASSSVRHAEGFSGLSAFLVLGDDSPTSREVYHDHGAASRGQFAIFEHVLGKACARRREIIESAKASKRTK